MKNGSAAQRRINEPATYILCPAPSELSVNSDGGSVIITGTTSIRRRLDVRTRTSMRARVAPSGAVSIIGGVANRPFKRVRLMSTVGSNRTRGSAVLGTYGSPGTEIGSPAVCVAGNRLRRSWCYQLSDVGRWISHDRRCCQLTAQQVAAWHRRRMSDVA